MPPGACHICRGHWLDVEYCPSCDHWFCATCRTNWLSRSIEAIKGLIKFQSLRAAIAGKEKCCGPD
jgi:hypothetical protein